MSKQIRFCVDESFYERLIRLSVRMGFKSHVDFMEKYIPQMMDALEDVVLKETSWRKDLKGPKKAKVEGKKIYC